MNDNEEMNEKLKLLSLDNQKYLLRIAKILLQYQDKEKAHISCN